MSFLSYFDRSSQQAKAKILEYLAVNVPELTDQNESNPLIRGVDVWTALVERLGYYGDFQARESFPPYMQLYRSAVLNALSFDYRIHSAQASVARMRFRFSNDGTGTAFPAVTIPAGTIIDTVDGIRFITREAVTSDDFPSNPLNIIDVWVDAFQFDTFSENFTSDGTANQIFVLTEKANGNVNVTISTVAWERLETFADSTNTSQTFYQSVNQNRNTYIQFGDDRFGAIPAIGSTIVVDYETTLGVQGNVDANTITNLISVITVPTGYDLEVTNPSRSTGGIDVEPLTYLRKRIPLALRTQRRAVTRQDYIDVTNLFPQVAQTAVDFKCGKFVDLYIAPVGGGIAPPSLITAVNDYLQYPYIMLTTFVRVLAAGEIRLQLFATVRILGNYPQQTTGDLVKERLETFFSVDNQQIGGTIHQSDIYEVIETTTGVSSSTIAALVPVPYARPLAGNNILDWTVAIQPTSTETVYWRIIFTSSSQFQLLKDNNFIGNFNTGVVVNLPEVIFTVTNSYVTGDQFEFYTYQFSPQDLDLAEFSLAVMPISDIQLNLEGGI